MSNTNSVLVRKPIKLPNKSGMDVSFDKMFSALPGTLIPIVCKPILPGESYTLGEMSQVQLPPMVSDFYGRIDAVFEAFFVPDRLLWGGHKDFMTHPTDDPVYPVGTLVQGKPYMRPHVIINSEFLQGSAPGAKGTLTDYLGIRSSTGVSFEEGRAVSILPYLAYHRVYDDWYRNTKIQSPIFYKPALAGNVSQINYLPYLSGPIGSSDANGKLPPFSWTFSGSNVPPSLKFGDGKSLFDLRQRNWARDYFTNATPRPQAGGASKIEFTVDQGGDGSFSIASLRAANSLQMWKERNNISYEYSDQIYVQYGIYPSDAVMDRPIFLGRQIDHVYTRSVFQTSLGDSGTGVASNTSPFAGSVGNKYGSSQAIGEGSLIDSFTASEHGYLLVMFSLVPHAYYTSGMARHFTALEVGDIPFPLLAGMGDQAVRYSEIVGLVPESEDLEFGYTDLYADYKYNLDELHGELRGDVGTLGHFALQRQLTLADVDEGITGGFLEIPTNCLDGVMQINADAINAGCWVQTHFICKKLTPLPAYSIPTLANLPLNGHTEYVKTGGRRIG